MGDTLNLLKNFCIFDFAERNCEKAISLLTENICWFGTSDFEDVHSIADARKYILAEIEALPNSYKIDFIDENYTQIGPSCGVAFLRFLLENEGLQISVRATATSRMEGGVEKLCSMHFSTPDATQQQNEYFPLAKHKEKIARTKHDLVVSTMAGGLMGGYMQKNFPFYFINQMMLDYLGYVDEDDFIRDIDGFVINGIHPHDRAFVNEATGRQLAEGNQYTVDYRMKKKDGSYIWVHDIGQKTTDETGKDVIVSVCYDVTQEREKQAQLDNLVNAVPCGVALYKMVDHHFKVLFHSKGVGALSGRTKQEFELLDAGTAACPEDIQVVSEALHKAATTDEVVSLDYRISHAQGGFVWITANYKRTTVKNGCPIIHAVFTEMPQQRELMNGLIEDSSTGIVVSDNTTHELLYMNSAVRKLLQINDADYMGKTCYQYLMGVDHPCSFCKHSCLKKGEEKEAEIYIPHLDKYFISQGKLSQWAGREAHVEYITDITASKKAQEQLDNLVQNIVCGVIVFQINPIERNYKIQYMNDGFCKLFEDTEESLRTQYTDDITSGVHPDDLDVVQRMTSHLMESRAHTDGTLRFILPNGKTKWIQLGVNTVPISRSETTTYATYIDITTQMQHEQQLRDMVHNVPGGMCLYRWDGYKLNPIVVSEQFSALLGDDAKTVLEQTVGISFTYAHPDDLSGLQEAMLEAFRTNNNFEYTYRSLNHKTNQYLWIYVQGIAVPQEDGTQLAYVSYTDITKERLTAQKLRASERALDAATEQAGFWYWNYDPSTDRAYFNLRCMRDFDLPQVLENYPQAWLDKGVVLPEYVSTYYHAAQKVKNGELQVSFEAQVKFQDGVIHWAEFRFANLLDENGKQDIIICTGHLIDEQKELLAKYELEKQKSFIGEKNLLIHAMFNLNTGETMEYQCSEPLKTSETKHQTMRESIATVAMSIVDKEERAKFLEFNDVEYLQAQLKQGNLNFSMEYRRKMPSGQIIWVQNIFHLVREPNTSAVILFEYCYDIHQQKMAEEVLYSATTYDYERIASVNFNIGKMINYGVLNVSPDEYLLDYEEARQSYARAVVTLEGRSQFLLNTDPHTVIEQVAQNDFWEFTTTIIRSEGIKKIVKSRFIPYDMENSIYILTRTNITGIIQEEEEKNSKLREALAIAEQANSAKSEFLSAMSHDIRTPMNAIIGMCELALEDENDYKQVHESLETIRSSSHLLLSLINSILDMSRIESGKMVLANEPFSFTTQVTQTISGYKALAEKKHLKFEFDVNVTHDTCIGDVVRIHSALDNILSNAIKYTPAGGTVTYRVSEKNSNKTGIGLYRFEISDTGIGMSPQKQKHLFEPFYRGETDLTANIEGTGLGLPIAKAIVDLKGGTISVESAEGVGTTFIVELPLHLVTATAIENKEKGRSNISARDLSGVHVLLCEDHPVNQKVVQRILEKAHAKVTIAENGQIGHDAFVKSKSETFDVILMDIQMPKMNGYEATTAIRGGDHPQSQTIPIIALSANAFAEDVQRSLSIGMNAHLAKPIEPKTLFQALERFLYT